MFSYSTYSKKRIRTKFPNNKVVVYNNKPVNGVDYICFGQYMDNIFHSYAMKPLYQMKFSVKKILSRNEFNNYCFLSVNVIEYQYGREIPHIKNVVVEGLFYNVYPDAEFEGMGYWKDNFKGKETFVLTEHSEVLTGSIASMFNFMKYVLKGKRVSDNTLKAILDIYDVGALDAIKRMDIGLSKIIKSSTKLTTIKDTIISNYEQEQAFKYLIEFGIPSSIAVKVLGKYQKMAMIQIKKNPYCLLNFADISLETMDRMAQREGLPYNNEDRLIACILHYIQSKTNIDGDIYVDKSELIGKNPASKSPINKTIKVIGAYKERILNSDIAPVLELLQLNNTLVEETNLVDSSKKCIYKSYYNMVENYIVDKLQTINTMIAHHFVPTIEIDSYLDTLEKSGIKLDILQKDAVKMALQNKLSILTGGPGTGKTQTIKAIVDTLTSTNPSADIQLCAPTGKASRRMSEVIGKPAETIHKKLNYMPFDSSVDLEEIDCDLLIIDETSMLDIDLFYKILKNTSDKTSILLVGDYNQLPSVGPGLILRDVIDSGAVPTTQLKKVFRQAKNSDIIDISVAILNNDAKSILEKPIRRQFKFKEKNTNDEIMEELIAMAKSVKAKKISILEFQILTPMNDGLLGTLGINKVMQEILNPHSASKEEIFVSPLKIFREGDKVIQTVNNYDLKVFNGSIGIIESIDIKKKIVTVDFDGDIIEYSAEEINELNLAYAITVHKSQGSEFDFVLMPVSSNHASMNNRNIMYTALTRAKKQIAFIGSAITLKDAIEKVETFSKKSQIKEKLI